MELAARRNWGKISVPQILLALLHGVFRSDFPSEKSYMQWKLRQVINKLWTIDGKKKIFAFLIVVGMTQKLSSSFLFVAVFNYGLHTPSREQPIVLSWAPYGHAAVEVHLWMPSENNERIHILETTYSKTEKK